MKRCPVCQGSFPDDANFCPMDAGTLEPIVEAAAAPVLLDGRFELGGQLAGARSGAVFAATDQQTNSPCVVKLVDVPAAQVQRAERELRQLQTLTAPQVAKVIAFGKHEGKLFVALEKVEGQTLDGLIASGARLPIDRVRKLAQEIGEGVATAAKVGVAHRDLAPKNVLVTSGDGVKLINFSFPVPPAGVPEYLSPELAQGKPVDQRSNIYSLASLIHAMLLGGPPFTGTADQVMQAHKSQPLASLTGAPGVPAEIARALTKALDKQPGRRQLTLRQFLSELAGTGPVAAKPAAPHAKTMFGYTALNPSDGQGSEPAQAPSAPPQAASPPQAAAPRAPVQAPVVQKLAGPQGNAKASPSPAPGRKGKFRETMWFKKGELDEEAAAQAAATPAPGGAPVSDKADELPMEDRYGDDGSLTTSDESRLSLRTGSTQMMRAVKVPEEVAAHMSEDELARELKAGQGKKIALILAAIVFAVAGIFVYNMLTSAPAKKDGASETAPKEGDNAPPPAKTE